MHFLVEAENIIKRNMKPMPHFLHSDSSVYYHQGQQKLHFEGKRNIFKENSF